MNQALLFLLSFINLHLRQAGSVYRKFTLPQETVRVVPGGAGAARFLLVLVSFAGLMPDSTASNPCF